MFCNDKVMRCIVLGAVLSFSYAYVIADTPLPDNNLVQRSSANLDATKTAESAPQAMTIVKKDFREVVGVVLKVNGIVKRVYSNNQANNLAKDSLFFSHDIIMTKENGLVAMRFNDGTLVILGPNSILQVRDYHFTPPPAGLNYIGEAKDHAVLKLFSGALKATMGTLVHANEPKSFLILTPRGHVELFDPKKSAQIELLYNNKDGLIVKAVGRLINSKGQVLLTETIYGLVSAMVGSIPTITEVPPLAFSDAAMKSINYFFNSVLPTTETSFDERILDSERSLYQKEQSTDGLKKMMSETAKLTIPVKLEEQGDDDGYGE